MKKHATQGQAFVSFNMIQSSLRMSVWWVLATREADLFEALAAVPSTSAGVDTNARRLLVGSAGLIGENFRSESVLVGHIVDLSVVPPGVRVAVTAPHVAHTVALLLPVLLALTVHHVVSEAVWIPLLAEPAAVRLTPSVTPSTTATVATAEATTVAAAEAASMSQS